MDEGGVFLTNGRTDICDCIDAFATENKVLTQSMTTILLMSKNHKWWTVCRLTPVTFY